MILILQEPRIRRPPKSTASTNFLSQQRERRDYHPSASIWTTSALGGMFLALWIARLPLSHGPIVLRSPVNGSEAEGSLRVHSGM
jgi:hypothetical protein